MNITLSVSSRRPWQRFGTIADDIAPTPTWSLRDLTQVGLVVEPLPSVLEAPGLSTKEIRTLVANRLEDETPLQILSHTGSLHVSGRPGLYLQITATEVEERAVLYRVELDLVQDILLARERSDFDQPAPPAPFPHPDEPSTGSLLGAPTWCAQAIRFTQDRSSALLGDIGDVVDVFIQDLLERPGTA